MQRDFTYIDDIVQGILGAMKNKKIVNHKIYNLGNSNPEILIEFVELIEKTLGLKAKKKLMPMQPGDVSKTYADIRESRKDLNYSPKVKISEGIPKFIDWYKEYYRLV